MIIRITLESHKLTQIIEKYFDEDAMKTENLFRYLITKHFYEMLAEA